MGALAGRMAAAALTRDIAVFGGDTSSHALIAMGARELRVSDQFVTAGPICHTDDGAAVTGCRLLPGRRPGRAARHPAASVRRRHHPPRTHPRPATAQLALHHEEDHR